MSLEDLTQKALQILTKTLDNEKLPAALKAEIALKILTLEPDHSLNPHGSAINTTASPVNEAEQPRGLLPVPDLYQLSESWQQWLVENKLREVPDQRLVEILQKQGIDETIAQQMVLALPQEITFAFLYPQWRSLQQNQLITTVYRQQEQNYPHNIVRRGNLSPAEFFQQYFIPHCPVILTELGNTEPWQTAQTLSEQFGDRPVFPQLTNHRAQPLDHSSQDTIETLNDYLKKQNPEVYLELDLHTWGATILEQFWLHYPLLSNYLDITQPQTANTYLRLQSTLSPLPLQAKQENFLVIQIQGESRWDICSPWQSHLLYADEHLRSDIDLSNPDLNRFPLLKDINPNIIHLQAGEAIFIPALWWSQCRMMQQSIQIIALNFKTQIED